MFRNYITDFLKLLGVKGKVTKSSSEFVIVQVYKFHNPDKFDVLNRSWVEVGVEDRKLYFDKLEGFDLVPAYYKELAVIKDESIVMGYVRPILDTEREEWIVKNHPTRLNRERKEHYQVVSGLQYPRLASIIEARAQGRFNPDTSKIKIITRGFRLYLIMVKNQAGDKIFTLRVE